MVCLEMTDKIYHLAGWSSLADILYISAHILRIRMTSYIKLEGLLSELEYRKPHNKEFNDLYSSPNIVRMNKSRRMRWAQHVASMREKRVYTRFWRGNLSERPRWRPRSRWEDNINMDLQEAGWGNGLDWSGRDSWRAHLNAVMSLRVS